MNLRKLSAAVVMLSLAAWMVTSTVFSADAPLADQRAAMTKQMQAGNFKVAYEGYQKLLLDPKEDPAALGEDLNLAIQCLANLGRVDEQAPRPRLLTEGPPGPRGPGGPLSLIHI